PDGSPGSPGSAAARAPTFPAVIEAVEVLEVCVPKRERNRINAQYGTIPDSRYPLVLVKAGGLTGVGEASTEQWWTGEDAASVRHVVQTFLAPELIGLSLGIREALDRMQASVVG